MKVLLDECLPKRLKLELRGHEASTVQEMGWAGVKNGALMSLIQTAGFQVFLTIDGSFEVSTKPAYNKFCYHFTRRVGQHFRYVASAYAGSSGNHENNKSG